MTFNDVSARFREKQKETTPPVAERNYQDVHLLRARILGVLIRDARLANGVSEEEAAQALDVSPDLVREWEFGNNPPSLPQLEMLAYYLGIPISHFWSDKTLGQESDERSIPQQQYGELRDRVIGAMLTAARKEAKLSQEELASHSGITVDQLAAYEYGQQSIPFPELTSLSSALRKPLSYFLEDSNRVGNWLTLKEEYQHFSELPEEMRAFVTQPANQAFIDIAIRLSRLDVQELRTVGENILNITF